MTVTDTIAAIATAPAPGAVGIVRLSGPQSWAILGELCALAQTPQPRQARLVRVRDASGEVLDEGLALAFQAPASYTAEDAVELQMHGNPYVLDAILQRCIDLGARLAQPGEFSQRAFENGQLDLAQAEAVADLIAAESEDAARAAQQSLQGVFSQQCEDLARATLSLRSLIEAWLDFPEEDIGQAQREDWANQIQSLRQRVQALAAEAETGVRLSQGMDILLVGAPNAGKSTLLNALARREVAIVSDLAGTTRDLVSEHLRLNGVPVRVTDSAGLRESSDPIEQMGVQKAHAAAQRADRIIALDAPDAPLPDLPASWEPRVLRVHNKCDAVEQAAGWQDQQLYLSAKTGAGLDQLALEISGRQPRQTGFSARRRHLQALARAEQHLRHSQPHVAQINTLELAAEELRCAQDCLGEITGEVHTEDLLGAIFSTFCIGK